MKIVSVLSLGICLIAMTALAEKPALKAEPVFEVIPDAKFEFGGVMGERLQANVRNWLMVAPSSNPAMLQIFRDRDRKPRRDLVPWAGEFAGKYLISATQALKITRDGELETYLKTFVADLIATQDADGYLGPFPKEVRMSGPGLWDLWGQYHVMLGLLYYHNQTGNAEALAACRKCADYFCSYYLDGDKRVVQAGSEEMNESSIHIFTLLYEKTGEARYLQLAREIEKDWETPPSGDYVRAALEGKAFYQMPKPRWESLHGIQAIAELYFITGEEKYKKAFTQIWKSILENDIHNTGGFSSGEQATGNPYDPRAIETCCTIAWMALTIDYLRMTGDPLAADWLEIATWNAVLGAQSPTGRWWTYNTPMDGERKASAHDIVFQARAGSPELNCCSVNGPRGLGMLSEWGVMRSKDGIVLNYYGQSNFEVTMAEGMKVGIVQTHSNAREPVNQVHPYLSPIDLSEYPWGETFSIRLAMKSKQRFVLRLRIASWSKQPAVRINRETVESCEVGKYLLLDREWNPDDEIEVNFGVHARFVKGDRDAAHKTCVYHGPVLLAYDTRYNTSDHTGNIPPLNGTLTEHVIPTPFEPLPFAWGVFGTGEIRKNGNIVFLTDFATAGMGGNPYATWLPYEGELPQ